MTLHWSVAQFNTDFIFSLLLSKQLLSQQHILVKLSVVLCVTLICWSRVDNHAKNIAGAPLLLWPIKLVLIPVLSFQQCQMTCWGFAFTHCSLSLMLCTLQGGKWRFRLSRLSPDGGLWKHWTVCRMYLEGCEIFSSFVLFFFFF